MHIHLSSKEKTPEKLLNSISGYLPLLYSIYSNRYKKSYSRAIKKDEYKNCSGSHGVAMNITEKTLELRIFPAVENKENLLWRTELIRLMITNTTEDHKEAFKNCFLDEEHPICKHLSIIFSEDKMIKKAKLFSSIAKEIDNLDVAPEELAKAEINIKKIKGSI